LELISGLCEKHDEERNKPLEALGSLVELDFDAKRVLDTDLEVLLVSGDPDRVVRSVFTNRPAATPS
jgi:hypothetical protein